MTEREVFEVPEGAVIIIRDPKNELGDDETLGALAHELHSQHPESLIVLLPSSHTTFEAIPEEELQALLEDLIEHRKAKREEQDV